MDKLILKEIQTHTVIGTLEYERSAKQNLLITAELSGDFHKAGMTDNLFDSFDYSAVENLICSIAETSSFHLLEALAEKIADEVLLKFSQISAIRLQIEKPRANLRARSVVIEIERFRR